jgi:hypothetical protein
MTIQVSGSNPDLIAIQNRQPVPMSFSAPDITITALSSSNAGLVALLQQAKFSNSGQRLLLSIGENDQNEEVGVNGVYYTPVYTERINYSEWQRRINKTFQELEVD